MHSCIADKFSATNQYNNVNFEERLLLHSQHQNTADERQ